MRGENAGSLAGCLLLASCVMVGAKTVYVSTNSLANGPGTAWSNAYHRIQTAVGAAGAGGTVMVTNGVYDQGGAMAPWAPESYLTNRVCIANGITVQSVNGPTVTTIVGAADRNLTNGPAAVRCAYVESGVLRGFTLTGGHTLDSNDFDGRGGGVLCWDTGVVEDCVITRNSSYDGGGGAACKSQGGLPRLTGCTLCNNTTDGSGGGLASYDGEVSGCTVISNTALYGGGAWLDYPVVTACHFAYNYGLNNGGGVQASANSVLVNCLIESNRCDLDGGGIEGSATLDRCVLRGNVSGQDGGGAKSGGMLLGNTLFFGKAAGRDGGGLYLGGGGLVNCTVANNAATNTGGGLYCSIAGAVSNTVIYFNRAGAGGANWINDGGVAGDINYRCVCTTPTNGLPGGQGCVARDPRFIDPVGGNYQLLYGSPCIDSGVDARAQGITNDLIGGVRPLDGNMDGLTNFDIGCYEYDIWTAYSDGDSMVDGAELIAGTNPTNSASYFNITAVDVMATTCRVSFLSVTNRFYTLESRTNLLAGQWSAASGQSNIPATGVTMSLSDTNWSTRFYRLKVRWP